MVKTTTQQRSSGMKTLDENQLQGICRTCGRKYRCKDALRYLDMQECNQYEELTNEVWLCQQFLLFTQMSTEEKAKLIADKIQYLVENLVEINMNKTAWIRWLKDTYK